MKFKDKYWKKPDQVLVFIILALVLFGLAAVSSASVVLSFQRFGHNNYYFFRQIAFTGAGLVAMFAVSRVDYHVWKKWSRPILLGAILLLVLVLAPGVGFRSGGTQAWFSIGSFFLQPSEFAKLALIFYLASWFERKPDAPNNFWFGILPPLLASILVVGLVVAERDLGTSIMLLIIIGTILFAAGTKLNYLGILGILGGSGLWLLIKAAPYRAARIVTYLNPTLDPQGTGYHINQALIAIGSAGWWGYGFGLSRQKHSYLPEPIGDSIFAVMAEELGFLKITFLIILFAAVGAVGLRVSHHAPDKFGMYAGVGITGWIVFQAVINIGAILNLLPLTGITLPFISYGGSSLLALCIAAGVLLNISRQRL